jgi:hypothetical protein
MIFVRSQTVNLHDQASPEPFPNRHRPMEINSSRIGGCVDPAISILELRENVSPSFAQAQPAFDDIQRDYVRLRQNEVRPCCGR